MCFSLPIEWSILPRFIWSQMILTVETNLSCYWINHIEVPLLSSIHQPLVVATSHRICNLGSVGWESTASYNYSKFYFHLNS